MGSRFGAACHFSHHLVLLVAFALCSVCDCCTFLATIIVYRRAIIKAIEELQDFHLRSHIDAIRRHLQASLGPQHIWNDAVFLKSLKGLCLDGDIEQCTTLNCGLSPEFKKRRTSSISALMEKRRSHSLSSLIPRHFQPNLTSHQQSAHEDTKESPKRKTEHVKLKIIPKKLYDKQL
jgi:hypothetical protein